ncbi:MAG TPA: glycosyltransferase [Polyangia bacterium]|nr:glycosyltransferase [Polyangia bacterium]
MTATTTVPGAPADGIGASSADQAPSRAAQLEATWREYYRRAVEPPRHPAARDFLNRDLHEALGRLIPVDASVLEVGCGSGDLLAALPNERRRGVDYLPEVVAQARARHPDLTFDVEDAIAPPPEVAPRADAVICDRLCHSVLDVKALLLGLKKRLAPGGRIYLTAFNYLWEVPVRLAEIAGLKRPAPQANWLSDADFRNLYDITGLEVVRFEDRLLLPMDVPAVGPALNRYLVRAPAMSTASLYRIYVLRDRGVSAPVRKASVSVIVPTRNEAGNVAAAAARTPVMGTSTELIFVEGHSTDDTWAAIQRTVASYDGPLKLRAFQQTGKGKGDAVRLGFAHATGDVLMILDADLTVPPEDLPSFYDVLAGGHADYVQGTRLVYPMEPGAMRFFNKLGNVAFSELFTYLLQQPIKDTLCGTKVLWRKDYERIAAARSYFGDFDPFGDFDLIFGAARLNLKIAEIPVRYRDRTYGETNISRWKHGWLLLRMSAVAARKIKFV